MDVEKTQINPSVATVIVLCIIVGLFLTFDYSSKSLIKKCEGLKQAFEHYSKNYNDIPVEARDKMANELTEYMVPCAEKGIYWK